MVTVQQIQELLSSDIGNIFLEQFMEADPLLSLLKKRKINSESYMVSVAPTAPVFAKDGTISLEALATVRTYIQSCGKNIYSVRKSMGQFDFTNAEFDVASAMTDELSVAAHEYLQRDFAGQSNGYLTTVGVRVGPDDFMVDSTRLLINGEIVLVSNPQTEGIFEAQVQFTSRSDKDKVVSLLPTDPSKIIFKGAELYSKNSRYTSCICGMHELFASPRVFGSARTDEVRPKLRTRKATESTHAFIARVMSDFTSSEMIVYLSKETYKKYFGNFDVTPLDLLYSEAYKSNSFNWTFAINDFLEKDTTYFLHKNDFELFVKQEPKFLIKDVPRDLSLVIEIVTQFQLTCSRLTEQVEAKF
ncbi:MAG: hypothetical protein NC218_01745 [Acetobacter sp.]|nr:hypothetical protein [Acetobacter sp.]